MKQLRGGNSRNRHRERLARREESYRNETELLKQQTSGLPNQRQIKLNNINLICKTLDLTIVKMAADGHCLFSAINSIDGGGKPEIVALSRHFKKAIHVIQAVGLILKFSKPDQYTSKQNSKKKNQEEGKIDRQHSPKLRATGQEDEHLGNRGDGQGNWWRSLIELSSKRRWMEFWR
ncbi:hypothetical protein BY996DRAFT_6521539 [Phakopsora pachyrhizi]|nr:hypothetical protein BY996DRAFT_6521539 [Phakopsora pachyrhizi]